MENLRNPIKFLIFAPSNRQNMKQHKIELLAPAKTADIGIEAFRHGADAVYIGSPAFGARAAAGNSVEDIARLAAFGHQYGAKTIVAMNTILTDQELIEAERLAWQLYEAGVDALIIQDLGLLQMNLPPIELHASTQTDNRTVEKTRLLYELGMTRVVMARELSVSQIRSIHEAVPEVELECFVHGALCVCISGQCYMSAALSGRSANRGECAQPCRLPMSLYTMNEQGEPDRVIAQDRHLLSLRDMNRSAYLEQLIEAGVTSLKIEGRLKDVTYVKNVVAYYRRLIDELLEKHPEWQSVSQGRCQYTFEPQLDKSFNRGFTAYFADGKREPMWNFVSPKSVGEYVGRIGRVCRDSFEIQGKSLNNGDGIYVAGHGFRINRYDPEKHLCYPKDAAEVCRLIRKGDTLYRNLDIQFEQKLEKPSATRRMTVDMTIDITPQQVRLSAQTCSEDRVEIAVEGVFEEARQPQQESVCNVLSKLGNTPFAVGSIRYANAQNLFVPNSITAELRRNAIEALSVKREKLQTASRKAFCKPDYVQRARTLNAEGILPVSYLANVLNEKARHTYRDMQLENVDNAFEIQDDKQGMVMQTRHCLKYAFGQCPKFHNPSPEPMAQAQVKIGNQAMLKISNRKFILKFGCDNDCISKIFTIFAAQK